MLEVGETAPQFELNDHEGNAHSLAEMRGSWVVLYFYPKDDTPGCTTEACEFRDGLAEFKAAGGKVLGVSADDEESHRKFAAKHSLNFPLLVDPDKAVLNAYGAYGEKNVFGKKVVGVRRITYLINPQGKVAKAWSKVTPAGHAAEVLSAIEEQKVTS